MDSWLQRKRTDGCVARLSAIGVGAFTFSKSQTWTYTYHNIEDEEFDNRMCGPDAYRLGGDDLPVPRYDEQLPEDNILWFTEE